jgi:hypothetical protein
MRQITCINYVLLTQCNRRCPDCCAGIGKRPIWYADWDYIAESAQWFAGIDRINLTGGEPTQHPQFREWAFNLRDLFGCNRLEVWTNGYAADKFGTDVWQQFDVVHFSHFGEWSFTGCKDNTKERDHLARLLDGVVKFDPIHVVHTKQTPGATKPCYRLHAEAVEYSEGLLYPCCTASGQPGAIGIKPGPNWRQDVQKVRAPCERCVFAEV